MNISLFKSLLLCILCMNAAMADGEKLTPRQELEQQTKEFRKDIIEITDNIYTAVGYDGSNTSMIIGSDGVIIVDTLRALESAEVVNSEFRKISNKPVKAIIYTHSHTDHIGGASVFAGVDKPVIYARSNFSPDEGKTSPVASIVVKRGVRQFGRNLPDGDLINRGIAPARTPTGGVGKGYLPPTKTFSGKQLKTTIAGIEIELVAAPGETDDQLYLWLPEQKILFTGDNYYKSFPNLYAIRGTRYRDVLQWGRSVREMAQLDAVTLIPGHTRPVSGASEVRERLKNYSHAIFSIFEQTIAGINRGLTPDELVNTVSLPEELAGKPYLREYYGSVAWTVRSIFNGYLGWFDGNPSNLFPLSKKDEAIRIAELSGGTDALTERLTQAFLNNDFQWACQLADYVIALEDKNARQAKEIKARSLRALAESQLNAPARNYYNVSAQELENN